MRAASRSDSTERLRDNQICDPEGLQEKLSSVKRIDTRTANRHRGRGRSILRCSNESWVRKTRQNSLLTRREGAPSAMRAAVKRPSDCLNKKHMALQSLNDSIKA